VRVSTTRQDLSPEVQRDLLAARAAAHGLALDVHEERVTATSLAKRDVLASLLDRLDAGEADALLVSKLDRLARSVRDFLDIVDRSRAKGWTLIVLDLDFRSDTATGRFIAQILAAVSEWEAAIISERTAEALAVKRSQGAKLGTPVATDPGTVARIVELAGEGLSSRAIAARLQAEGVRTAMGKSEWSSSTVAGIIRAERARNG
jgi:DNA invertase Pin-like site-specific DNA recombinase